jgi:hypothetical protein
MTSRTDSFQQDTECHHRLIILTGQPPLAGSRHDAPHWQVLHMVCPHTPAQPGTWPVRHVHDTSAQANRWPMRQRATHGRTTACHTSTALQDSRHDQPPAPAPNPVLSTAGLCDNTQATPLVPMNRAGWCAAGLNRGTSNTCICCAGPLCTACRCQSLTRAQTDLQSIPQQDTAHADGLTLGVFPSTQPQAELLPYIARTAAHACSQQQVAHAAPLPAMVHGNTSLLLVQVLAPAPAPKQFAVHAGNTGAILHHTI